MATSQNKLSIRAPALECLECKAWKLERKQISMVDEKSYRPLHDPESVIGIFATWNNFFCDRADQNFSNFSFLK